MSDEAVIRRFYNFLGHEFETEVRVLPVDGGRPTSHFASNEHQFYNICSRYDGNAHVYAGINERCIGGTRSNDVMILNSIVLDIDVATPDGCGATDAEMHEAVRTASVALDWVKGHDLHPHPVRIGSGNGCYLWLCVPPFVLRGNKHRRVVRGKLKKFAEMMSSMLDHDNLKVDVKVTSDLARIIRVPGTRNIKGVGCGVPGRDIGRYAFEIDPLYRVESTVLLPYIDQTFTFDAPASWSSDEKIEFREPGDKLLKVLYRSCPRMRGLAGGGGAGDISELSDYHTWLYFGVNLVKLAGDAGAEEWERVSRHAPGYNPDDFDTFVSGNKLTEVRERFDGVPGCSSLGCPLLGTPRECGVNTPMGMVWRTLKRGGLRSDCSMVAGKFGNLGAKTLHEMWRAVKCSMDSEEDFTVFCELSDYCEMIEEQISRSGSGESNNMI